MCNCKNSTLQDLTLMYIVFTNPTFTGHVIINHVAGVCELLGSQILYKRIEIQDLATQQQFYY